MSEDEISSLMTDEDPKPSAEHAPSSAPDENGYISDGDDKDQDNFGEVVEDNRSEEEIAEEDKKIKAQSLKLAGELGNFGLFLLIALVFGYFIGHWMDGLFGTKPVFTIFWIVAAIAASVREMYRNIQKAKNIGEK